MRGVVKALSGGRSTEVDGGDGGEELNDDVLVGIRWGF